MVFAVAVGREEHGDGAAHAALPSQLGGTFRRIGANLMLKGGNIVGHVGKGAAL